MILSNETIEILKNFSTINPTLLVRPGNVLKTIAPKRNILASAKIKEEFPSEFAIGDLTKFIMILSSYSNPELEFEEKHISINEKNFKTRFLYGGNASVTHPPSKDVTFPNIEATFTVSNEALTKILRLSSGLHLPNIVLTGRNGKSYFSGTDVSQDISDNTEYEVGISDTDYKAVFELENMKVIARDYDVKVTSGMAHFKSTKDDVEYWIACSNPKK